jgi:hypothetical protein
MQNYELSLTIPNFGGDIYFLPLADGLHFLDYLAVIEATLDVP